MASVRRILNRLSTEGALSGVKTQIKSTAGMLLRARRTDRTDLPLSCWNLGVRPTSVGDGKSHGRRLVLSGVDLHDLLARWGSPLHVVNAAKLESNIDDFQAIPDGVERGCEIYYSYKTNPVPGVLRYLHDRGIGAEVISAFELWLAFELGLPPHKIIYNGPAKSDDSIRQAIERGILSLNVNHREEIRRIAAIARAVGKKARISIRVSGAAGWSAQFGIPIEGGQALAAFAEAMATPELSVVGVHAHRGCRMHDLDTVKTHVDHVLRFTDVLRAELGLELEMLDFGGSLAVPTVRPLTSSERRLNTTFLCPLAPPDPTQRPSIRSYVSLVAMMVHRHYESRRLPVPRVLLEPGRAMTGDTQMLLCSVMETKVSPNEELTYAVLDAGINIADYVQSELHQVFSVNHHGGSRERLYRLVGPTCQPGDVLYPAWTLPELRPGDSLAIMDSGAYFVPSANSFSFPQPAIVMLHNDSSAAPGDVRVSLLRRAESFPDRMARDHAWSESADEAVDSHRRPSTRMVAAAAALEGDQSAAS